ncbi:MAG: archaeal proteasome endopeptidase complex subunit alpha [Candidatus Aenigmarchaeota archaeon]|nr:archaeal proteasome endopeptidase complex subunit alpha [Candidatus Aenigmarchaeota archaeon]
MGYDRTIAVFSPDGRLFQVEYAKEAVKRGTTCVGVTFKDGIVLASIKPNTSLMVSSSSEKIFQVDEHIGVVAAGLLADARVLVNQARVRAQVNKITYEEPIDIWGIARLFGDRMQISTLYAGLRPFGVTLLVGGVDKTGMHLIESDPSGMLFEWNAYAIGRGAVLANKILKQRWKKDLQEKDALELAVDVIAKTEKDKKEGSIDLAVVKKDGKFKKIAEDENKKLAK